MKFGSNHLIIVSVGPVDANVALNDQIDGLGPSVPLWRMS